MSKFKGTDFNFPAFNDAATRWRAAGWDVCNPAEHFDGRTDLARHEYMRKDIEELLKCDAIVMLSGWFDSNGAQLEYKVAKEIGLDVYFDEVNRPAIAALVTEHRDIDPVDVVGQAIGTTTNPNVGQTRAEEIGDFTYRGIDGSGYKASMDTPAKIPLALIPPAAIRATGRALQHGARRYSAWNWARGMNYSEVSSALMRHLMSWLEGEEQDPDSGLSHLDHIGACHAFLCHFEANPAYHQFDDRLKQVKA